MIIKVMWWIELQSGKVLTSGLKIIYILATI